MDARPEVEGADDEASARGLGSSTYGELCIPGLRQIVREQLQARRTVRARRPTGFEVEILAALWSHGFLFSNQIWRRWWPNRTQRWAYHALKQMTLAGWLERYRLIVAGGGSHQRFYGLAEGGFELARGRRLRGRQGIPREAKWRRLVVDRTGGLPPELHVNGWTLTMERLAGELMTGWRGPLETRLLPPRRRVRGEWVDLRPGDVVLGTNHRLSGHQATVLEAVNPHATIELQLPDRNRAELMIEYQHDDDPFEVQERLQRYDLFVSGWAHLLDRYRPPAGAPIVVFVCPNERALTNIVETADRALTTRIAKAGAPTPDWPYPGRQSIVFALEPDMHRGSLRAFALALHPPDRDAVGRAAAARDRLREIQIVDPSLLPERFPVGPPRPRSSRLPSRPQRAKR